MPDTTPLPLGKSADPKFVPLSPEENKYLIIESNMLGSDVRNIFVGSLLLLIK